MESREKFMKQCFEAQVKNDFISRKSHALFLSYSFFLYFNPYIKYWNMR